MILYLKWIHTTSDGERTCLPMEQRTTRITVAVFFTAWQLKIQVGWEIRALDMRISGGSCRKEKRDGRDPA
jgi:hypothetical protein